MALITVVTPGTLTTVQDLGRWGWQGRGVPVAGPMDPWSHRLANTLVGNRSDAATLETTFAGPELRFEDERTVVVTGAEFDISVDGRSVPSHEPFVVAASSVLRFGRRRRGVRAYLAIAGGIAVPSVLGSRSTHLPSAMGGVDGRALRRDDRIPLGDRPHRRPMPMRRDDGIVPLVDGMARLRVIPGPQPEYFNPDALSVLQSAPYRVDAHSDRMGFRLVGSALIHARDAEIISDATPIGAVQVPSSGQPILLMADRQTTGGYPILATVIAADIGLAGQLGPGDSIRFVVSSLREAIATLIAQEQALMAMDTDASR